MRAGAGRLLPERATWGRGVAPSGGRGFGVRLSGTALNDAFTRFLGLPLHRRLYAPRNRSMTQNHRCPRDDDRDVAGVRRLLRWRRDRHHVAVGARRDRRHLAAARDPGGRAADGPAPPVVAVRGGAAADARASWRRRFRPHVPPAVMLDPVRRQLRASGRGRRAVCGEWSASRRGWTACRAWARSSRWRRSWCRVCSGRGGGAVRRRRLRGRLLDHVAAARCSPRMCGAVIVAAPIVYLVEGGLAAIRRTPRRLAELWR